ncbi:hypothetical protein H0H92_010873 [Tricholoma furcatifolium]|nr:hypothetical protein H0H92_010873 [Tricholoma furcatifolium]
MRTFTVTRVILACLSSAISSNAVPLPTTTLSARDTQPVDVLYIRDFEAEILARAMEIEDAELEARTQGSLTPKFASRDTEIDARDGAGRKHPEPAPPMTTHYDFASRSPSPETLTRRRHGLYDMEFEARGLKSLSPRQRPQNMCDTTVTTSTTDRRDIASDDMELEACGRTSNLPTRQRSQHCDSTVRSSRRDIASNDLEFEARGLKSSEPPRRRPENLRDTTLTKSRRGIISDDMEFEARDVALDDAGLN